MNNKKRETIATGIVVFALLMLSLSGCADVRRLTYPKHFTWLGKSEVNSVMHRFSDSLWRIDTAAKRKSPGDREIINIELSKMIEEALSLMATRQNEGSESIVTNHLLIDEHLDDFLVDLNQAKMLIENDANNTYAIGNLTGSCAACHQFR